MGNGENMVHDKMLKIDGKPFRCDCGCNVFRATNPGVYRCNSCRTEYADEKISPVKKYTVKLTMFKGKGKFGYEGEYESTKEAIHEIWAEVRKMRDVDKKLPGLVPGACEFIIHIEVPGHPHNHPRLLMLDTETLGDLE